MARATLRNVRLSGLSVAVPRRTIDNLQVSESERSHRERLVRNIGIRYRRICESGQIFSDLGQAATEDVLKGVGWDKSTVDAYIWVTQSPEYVIPATSIVVQDRVGLAKSTIAFDINLGCSGYPYGLYVVGSMLAREGIKRAIVVVGDQSASDGSEDSGREILFSDAASATALEYDESAPPMYFEGFSDGSGYEAIIVPHGGRRNPFRAESLIAAAGPDGVIRSPIDVALNGPAILNFSINVAPAAIQSVSDYSGIDVGSIDHVILHQANRMINETIRRKLNMSSDKVPESLFDYGNTSSASIPVTIVHRAREAFKQTGTKWIMCGFGIGLSWASIVVETAKNTYCSPVIEV